jgi:hypothetical protein
MRTRRMPWKETGPFAERRRFIVMPRDSDESFTAICDRFGNSRQKGYKWLARFEEGGLEALVDRSRRPHSNSGAVSTTVVELIVELWQRRPRSFRSRHARTARHSRQHQAQQPELRTSHPDAERCA